MPAARESGRATIAGAASRAALVLLAMTPAIGRAQLERLDLVVEQDPRGCVHEAALRAHVDRYLRVHEPIEVQVVVHARKEPLGFELRRKGAFFAERHFDVLPEGCDARLDALSLAIAVAVEHAVGPVRASVDASPKAAATASTEDARAGPEASPRDRADANTDAPPAPASASATSRPLTLTLLAFAGAGVLIEVMPEPAAVLHAGAELGLGPVLALSLAGLYAPEVQSGLGGGSVSSSLFGGRALACAGTGPSGLRFQGCAGVAGAAISASGHGDGLERPRSVRVGWLAGVLRVAAGYPASGPFGARLALDGQLNAVRAGVRVERDSQPDLERVAGVVGLSASLELWLALR
jgi:hypothetical protein